MNAEASSLCQGWTPQDRITKWISCTIWRKRIMWSPIYDRADASHTLYEIGLKCKGKWLLVASLEQGQPEQSSRNITHRGSLSLNKVTGAEAVAQLGFVPWRKQQYNKQRWQRTMWQTPFTNLQNDTAFLKWKTFFSRVNSVPFYVVLSAIRPTQIAQ